MATQARNWFSSITISSGPDKEDAKALLEPLANDPDGFVPATLRLAAISFQEGQRPQAYKT